MHVVFHPNAINSWASPLTRQFLSVFDVHFLVVEKALRGCRVQSTLLVSAAKPCLNN